MNTILVNTVLGKVDNIEEILPKEFAVVEGWQKEGVIAHLFLKEAGTGAVLIFNETDEQKARELIAQLPLHTYFEQTEYIVLDKKF
ncbi:hypothetical protein [uncultured Sphingobacterium sp.]|uniref:hypothetical protein n=1 Tax=uncultured Sphingobacterium sp. TaxID=182688 RepID=UPI0037484810